MGSQTETVTRHAVRREVRGSISGDRGKRGSALCRGLDQSVKGRLEALAEPVRVPGGTVLCAQGLPAAHVFSLLSGVLKLFKTLRRGRRQVSRFLYAGDFLCAAQEATEYRWTVQAVTAAEVWRFDKAPFVELLRDTPELQHRLLTVAFDELESARDHMLLLAHMGAEEKVASFLLWLARRQDGGDTLVLPMTRRDIAEYLGLQTETVSRTLRGFHRRGVIALPDPSHAEVLRPGVLQSLAGGQRAGGSA